MVLRALRLDAGLETVLSLLPPESGSSIFGGTFRAVDKVGEP